MASSLTTSRLTRPWEERQNSSRVSYLVAEIDMIRAGVVIVDRQFDEAQPENFRVEVEGLLRIARYCCDVVKTENAFDHDDADCAKQYYVFTKRHAEA